MKRMPLWFGVFVIVTLIGLDGWRSPAQGNPVASVADFFNISRGFVRDTNGDGIADVLATRIIVPAKPSVEDVQAATNIAARLGFETMAATLPIVLRDDEVTSLAEIPILIGRENAFVRQLVERGALDVKSLGAGQGLISIVHAPLGGADGLVVVGGDNQGTLTAGIELAGHLPRLWSMSGMAIKGVEQQVVQYLKSKGVEVSSAGIVSLLVDSDQRGLASVTARLECPGAACARAAKALEDLDLAHRRGLEARTLDFANVAATAIEIAAGGNVTNRVLVHRSGMNARTLTPPIDPDELASDSPGERGRPAENQGAPAKSFDLSTTYSIDGWYGDSYTDLIPDRADTAIVVGEGRESLGAAHIAARLGLETTGINLPIVKADAKVKEPNRELSPILVGSSNSLVGQLVKIGKVRLDDLQPGDGLIQIVPRAFGNATATVVAGRDVAGTDAASLYLARRLPLLWETARGAFGVQDVITESARFLQARNSAGQASQAVTELENVLEGLKDKTIESFEAKLFLEKGNPQLDGYFTGRIKSALKDAAVTVTSQGITDPVAVFEDKIDLPWEVDEFWSKFRAEVLPKVKPGSKVQLESRLSEAPEVRRQIAEAARAELVKAGTADAGVRILSAYKQGFTWLTEQVIPELKGKPVKSVKIKVATYHPDLSKKYKFYMVPSRWLQELYPVDEIFQRDLGVSKESFFLELVEDPKDIYSLEASDAAGKPIYRAAFSPKFVEREYLEKFPGWSRVQVTTGWLSAVVDGSAVVDSRIQTDPERFWDYYQSKVLPRVYDHVMKTTENKPMPDKQPFFRDFDIEIWMSEPDFRMGVDEEMVSSLEALHEDIYFDTLDFFDALGRTTVKRRIAAPGKILPIIHPDRPGKPGQVRVLYAGNASAKPKLEISYKEKGAEKPAKVTRELTRIDTTAPIAMRTIVRGDRVRELELQIEAKDDREAARAADAIDSLSRLHDAGLFKSSLSYDHIDGIAVSIAIKDARTRRMIRNTGESLPSRVRIGAEKPGQPIVTWGHIISPDESEDIVGKLAAYPEVKAYRAGISYRGREISVMEITSPTPSELVSLAKAAAYKPTIFITGRQHANEVSSTSHILRLAELLVTDPAYKDIVKKLNVILQPVENPDGAQMAYDLQKLTPNHMLHAGRYSALGVDVGSQVNQADPLLPEALVRGKVWRDWLPDIYLNPHGYPSHEWVQQFAGYVPPGFRSYLSTRGWYTNISGLRDPRYPNHAQVIEAIREAVVREVNSNPDVRAMNLRTQARYRRWAYGFAPYLYNQEVYKDTTIYYGDPETGEPSGSHRASTGGGRSMNSWPQVTYFNGMTEAPDETAQGDWLDLVTKPGFSYLMASIKYLRDGQYEVNRIEDDGQREATSITIFRPRPVLPAKAAPASRY